jgi:sulfite reductase alpha subunit-like flavoprotein
MARGAGRRNEIPLRETGLAMGGRRGSKVSHLMHLSTPPSCAYTKDNPLPAKLLENRVLNRDGSGKDTRHLVVDIAGSGLTYQAGDSLGVYPSNRPQLVEEVIELLGATGNEPVWPARATAAISLREALTGKLSLSGPTKKILETLASKTSDPKEKAQLEALLAPEATELRDAFLGEREYIDLLEEFPAARLTPQELVDHLRRLMPRLYSIASSPLLHPGQVHLTVAPVRHVSGGPRDPAEDPDPGVCRGIALQAAGGPRQGCHHGGARHGRGAVPRLCAGAGGDERQRPQLAVFWRPAPGHRLPLRR